MLLKLWRLLLGALALFSFVCVCSVFASRHQLQAIASVWPSANTVVLYGVIITGMLGSSLLLLVPTRSIKAHVVKIWIPSLLLVITVIAYKHHGIITPTDLFFHANEALLAVPATAFALWCSVRVIRPVLLYAAKKKQARNVGTEVPLEAGIEPDDGVVVSLDAFREARGK